MSRLLNETFCSSPAYKFRRDVRVTCAMGMPHATLSVVCEMLEGVAGITSQLSCLAYNTPGLI